MTPYKNRTINPHKPVKVYRNLNRKGVVYSVLQDGLVVAHTSHLLLKDCKFVVSEAGRQRVIREKRKNVHAFIQGHITESAFGTTAEGQRVTNCEVTYNPYRHGFFTFRDKDYKVKGAWVVQLRHDGVYVGHAYV